jgi:hypothetical protein
MTSGAEKNGVEKMSSTRKKKSVGAAIALALMITVIVAFTPALLGATMILDKSETFTIGSNSYYATLNIQVFDLGGKYEYAFTLTNNPDQPGFMIFAMSIGWGTSTDPVSTVQLSDLLPGTDTVALRTPPVDDPGTWSTRIYAGSVPLMGGDTFDTVLMYFAPEALSQHYISISSNKGSAMQLVKYDYADSVPEPATLLLLAGAVFTMGLVSRRRKMII